MTSERGGTLAEHLRAVVWWGRSPCQLGCLRPAPNLCFLTYFPVDEIKQSGGSCSDQGSCLTGYCHIKI